jgi:hypothetical protein
MLFGSVKEPWAPGGTYYCKNYCFFFRKNYANEGSIDLWKSIEHRNDVTKNFGISPHFGILRNLSLVFKNLSSLCVIMVGFAPFVRVVGMDQRYTQFDFLLSTAVFCSGDLF